MAQIDRYIEAPYNGVSQAPPQVRMDNQAEAIEDTLLSVPQGAIKRPPFEHLSRLAMHPGDTSGLFAVVEREGDTDVFLTLTNEAGVIVPRVYSPQAGYAAQPIGIDIDAQLYLNTGNPNPASDLVAVTVEDYTFLLNRKAPVLKQAGFAPQRNKEAMVWVRQAAYGRTFTVTVSPTDGTPVTATVSTPNGKDTTDAKYVDTEVIARTLATGEPYTLVNEGSATGQLSDLIAQGFTVSRNGPVIYLQAPAGVDFTVDVADGQGGTALLAIKDKVQRFADLPQKSVDGFTVRVTQQSGSDSDDFFVRYEAAAGTGSGIWQETIGPGSELGLNPKTMPVGLVFDGGWQVRVLDWKAREVGDQKLAPDPDFVGVTIQDLTFWRGRLALISGQAVTLSSAEDPLQLYPETLSSVLDSDPITLVSPLPGKGTLSRAVPFDSRLVVFADQGQAAVTAQGVLTPATASIDVAGGYEYAGPLRPQEVGERLYFLAPRGEQASVVYELEGGQDSQGKYRLSGDDLTAAVPRYVPAGIDRVAASPVNYLVVYGRSGDQTLYPHLFRYADRQKVQNGWSRWWLPEGWALGGVAFQNTRLYVLACKAGQAHLVVTDLAPDRRDPHPSARILTHLDFRFSGMIPPYPVTGGGELRYAVAAPGTADYPEGMDVTEEELMALAGVPLLGGYRYTSIIEFSRFYSLGPDNRPLRAGRLSVRRCKADLADSGYTRAEVIAGSRAPRTFEFTGHLLDSPVASLDKAPVVTSTLSFPVGANNEAVTIRLINDSHLPSKLLGLEWIGELNLKASR